MNEGNEAYLVQCISGDPSHVMRAVRGSELEAMCIKRAESGMLDALILGADECPACVVEAQNNRASGYAMYLDCPMTDIDGICGDNCPCKKSIPDSPWQNQVQGLAPTI